MVLVSLQNFLKSDLLLTLLRKKIVNFFSSDDMNILWACIEYCMWWLLKVLASSEEKKLFFCRKVKIKSILKIFFGENEHRFPHFLIQISVSNFIPHNIYFLIEKTYLFLNLHPWNYVTVSKDRKMTENSFTVSLILGRV